MVHVGSYTTETSFYLFFLLIYMLNQIDKKNEAPIAAASKTKTGDKNTDNKKN